MLSAFAKSELVSALQIRRGIVSNTLTSGNTINTYSASPQPAAGIDAWDAGYALFRKMLIVVDVASITAGTLTVSLYDDNEAITTANGDANTKLAVGLAAISAAGLYAAEIDLRHKFASTTTRYTNIDAESGLGDTVASEIQRYHSIRAVAAGGNAVFNVLCIYGSSSRGFPRAKHTALAATYAT